MKVHTYVSTTENEAWVAIKSQNRGKVPFPEHVHAVVITTFNWTNFSF